MSDFTQNKSYEQILSEMTEDFKEKSGFYPDNASDIGIRLKVLAAQIYSLNYKLNWIWKQSSPLSATGEYLERHAAEKGLERKSGKKAKGVVKFYLQQPISTSVDIEQGTVVATAALASAKRFETLEPVTILAGQTGAEVSVQALEEGLEYNVSAGSVRTVEGGSALLFVTNEQAFTGGTQPETDEDLRERIVASYQLPVFAGTASYYKNMALSDSEVVSAGVVPMANGVGTVKVAIATADAAPSSEVLSRLYSMFNSNRQFGVNVSVSAAAKRAVNVSADVSVKSGYNAQTIYNECLSIIKKYIQSLGVGDSFIRADLYKQIMETEGVKNFELYSPFEDCLPSADTLLTEGTISINTIG